MILLIIFGDICINIWKLIICKYIFSSMANPKCTLSDRQMYPWAYMYPRLGTPALAQWPDKLWSKLLVQFCTIILACSCRKGG